MPSLRRWNQAILLASLGIRCGLAQNTLQTSDVTTTLQTSDVATTLPTSTLPTSTLPTSTLPTSTLPTSTLPTSTLPTSTLPTSTLPTSTLPTSTLPTSDTTTLEDCDEIVYETIVHTVDCNGDEITQLPHSTSESCSLPGPESVSSSILVTTDSKTVPGSTSRSEISSPPDIISTTSPTVPSSTLGPDILSTSTSDESSTLDIVSTISSTISSSTTETGISSSSTSVGSSTTATGILSTSTSVGSSTISTASNPTTETATGTTTTASVSASSTPDSDGWFGDDDGVPALTADDILFITSERTLAELGFPDPDGSTAPLKKRSIHERQQNGGGEFFGGANTQAKWDKLKMDQWLEMYVAGVDIPGQPGKKLVDSTSFFSDFWLSTGEENVVVCDSLLDTCNVAEVSDEKRFASITRNDALRAQFVRQVMKVWQSSNKQAYDILSRAVSDSQLNILTAHKLFVQDTPPPATKLFDVIVPAVAAVAAFVPVLTPAAELLTGVYALSKALDARDDVSITKVEWEDGIRLDNVFLDHSSSEDDIPRDDVFLDYSPPLGKRQFDDAGQQALEDIVNRLTELEKKPPKKWIEEVNKNVKQLGSAADKAAKAVVAFKGLNPKLPRSTITSWDTFDLRVQQALLLFPQSIIKSFDEIKLSWWPRESAGPDGSTLLSAGMRSVLLGGAWSRVGASTEPASVSGPKVKKYLDAVIFMQYVQQQAIYFWTQSFDSKGACTDARDAAIDANWLASDGWYNCENIGSKWELQYARKPQTNRGSATATVDSKWAPFGDIIALGYKPQESPKCFVQERSGNALRTHGFEQNTAGLNKWNDGLLSAIGYDFRMADVFKASRECQTSLGDPFKPVTSPRETFFPSMLLRNKGEQVLSGILPTCLFNMPVFEVGRSDLNDWCKNHVGIMRTPGRGFDSAGWVLDDEVCGEKLELWAIQADTKLCGSNQGDYLPQRSSRPGCGPHERGIMQVRCASKVGQ